MAYSIETDEIRRIVHETLIEHYIGYIILTMVVYDIGELSYSGIIIFF